VSGRPVSVLERARDLFAQIVAHERLADGAVSVHVVPLTAEEAIGRPWRRDFPIIVGKERVIEARFRGRRGQAFTDSPREFGGTLADVLQLDLTTNQNRAVLVAVLNAVLSDLGMVDATVHCKDDDPEHCALEIAATVSRTFGRVSVGLIGFNPAIAERLVDTFGADQVRITDLDPDNVGRERFGVTVWDGNDRTADLVDDSDVVVVTGTTLVNATFDDIWRMIRTRGRHYLVYGMTAAGVCQLMGLDRICPRAQSG
jgi:hypothetical protein